MSIYGDLILFDVIVGRCDWNRNGILKHGTLRIYIAKDYYYLLIGYAGYFTAVLNRANYVFSVSFRTAGMKNFLILYAPLEATLCPCRSDVIGRFAFIAEAYASNIFLSQLKRKQITYVTKFCAKYASV